MRILRVITSMRPEVGGPPQGIRNLTPALDELGHETHVITMDAPGTMFPDDPFEIIALGPGRSSWQYSKKLAPWLRRNVLGFDVVIIHGLWQFPTFCTSRTLARLATKGPSPPAYIMPHGMLDPWFQKDPSRRIKALRNTLYWKFLEHKSVRLAEGLLFTCEQELRLAQQPFSPYAPRSVFNVGYGVAPPPTYTPEMKLAFEGVCQPAQNRNYLLFLSRIHPKKGLELLIEAYEKVARNHCATNPIPLLVIAGPDDSDYAQQLIRLVAAKGLLLKNDGQTGAGIHFPGMLQGDAKWGAFHGCDGFILPSYQENFGIAVVEAMACGKYVLISDQVNIASDLEADGAASVFQTDTDSLVQALTSWISLSGNTKLEMHQKAAECYHSRYLPSSAARRLVSVLQRSRQS